MKLEEALAWLRGERSTINYAESKLEADQRDAALTQQAYWIARAHRERLTEEIDALVEQIVIAVDNCFEPAIGEQPEGDAWLDDIAREVKLAVLAALDGETT